MKTIANALVVFSTLGSQLASGTEYLVAESRWCNAQVWSVPMQPPSEDFWAANIVLRQPEGYKIITLESLKFTGDVVQTWTGATPNAQQPPVASDSFRQDWIAFDSHLLITPNMVGGGAGSGYFGISESNDVSLTNVELPTLDGVRPNVGLGDIQMAAPADAFFFETEFQTNELTLARIVTPRSSGNVRLTIGFLGEGCTDFHGVPSPFFDQIPIQFVPENCSGLGVWILLGLCELSRIRRRTNTAQRTTVRQRVD